MQKPAHTILYVGRPWQAWLICAAVLAIQIIFFWLASSDHLSQNNLVIAWAIFLIFDAICLYLVNLPIFSLKFDGLSRAVIVEKWRLYSGTDTADFSAADIAKVDVAKLESTDNTSYRLRLTMRGGASHYATGDLGSSSRCEALAANLRAMIT